MNDDLHEKLVKYAEEEALSPNTTKRFIQFAEDWAATKDIHFGGGYGNEWAARFRKQEEYIHADGSNVARLAKIDGDKAFDIFVKQLLKYDPSRSVKNAIAYVEKHLGLSENETLKGRNTCVTTHQITKRANKMVGTLPNFTRNFRKLVK